LLISAQPAPSYPELPKQFTATFSESWTYPVAKTVETTGIWYYDDINKLQRTDRVNGWYDNICGMNGMPEKYNTECQTYNSGGRKYVYYPEHDECCYCCGDLDGCGLIKPNWLDNAQYLGKITYDGKLAYKWNQQGIGSNIWIETAEALPEDRTVIRLDMDGGQNAYNFTEGWTKSVSDSVFTLPSSCSPTKTCDFNKNCALFRSGILLNN
jgi:hypothetical protein